MALNKRFELEPGVIPALNLQAKSIQRAAAAILGVPVPLVVFDRDLQVPPEHQVVEWVKEKTLFGVAMIPQRIRIHPRELTALADSVADNFPNIPDPELLERVDFQIWRFLVMTTVEGPAQGREDFRDIVRQTLSTAFSDWAATKYGVSLSDKTRDRG